MKNKEYHIEVSNRGNVFDPMGESARHDMVDLGIKGVKSVKVSQLYRITADSSQQEIDLLCGKLLSDPVTQRYLAVAAGRKTVPKGKYVVEVWPKPGVTDAVGESVMKAGKDMGIRGLLNINTGLRYYISGTAELTAEKIDTICGRLLANPVIQTYTILS